MALALKFQDTFTGSDSTSLASHSPDLDTPASGWAVNVGGIMLNSNKATDNNSSAGNRANTGAFSTIDVDVQATISSSATGEGVFFGVAARNTSQASTNGVEFYYDMSTAKWNMDDNSGTVGSVNVSDSPSFPVLIKLECRSGVATGFSWNGSAWVQKLQLTGLPTTSTRKCCGVLIGNFTGGGVLRATIDGYEVYEYSASGASIAAISSGYHQRGLR